MNDLKIDQPTRDAMQVAADDLDELQRLNDAIDTSAAAVISAQAEYEARASERASMEADLAMLSDPAEVKSLEAKIRKLSTAVDEARNLHERQERVAAALTTRLLDAESKLPEELVRLQTAVSQHSTSVAEAVYADIEKACGPLLEALRVAQVAHMAVVNQNLARVINDVKVPALGYGDSTLIEGRKHRSADGAWVDISQGWEADEKLVALHATAVEPRNLLAKVKAYKTRAERMKVVEPYVIKGYSHTGRNATWGGNRAPVPKPLSRPSALPAASHQNASRPAVQAADLSVGSAALRDPAFEQFRP